MSSRNVLNKCPPPYRFGAGQRSGWAMKYCRSTYVPLPLPHASPYLFYGLIAVSRRRIGAGLTDANLWPKVEERKHGREKHTRRKLFSNSRWNTFGWRDKKKRKNEGGKKNVTVENILTEKKDRSRREDGTERMMIDRNYFREKLLSRTLEFRIWE